MGNPHRGDTPIEVGGEKFTLCYDLNACAMVMERLGIDNFQDLANDGVIASKMNLTNVIFLLWAGLQHHHPELTVEEVGQMEWDVTDVGKIIAPAFEKGLVRDTPPKGREVGRGGPKARLGTGRRRG